VAGHPFTATRASADSFGGSVIPLIEQFVAGRAGTASGEANAWAAEQRQLDAAGDFFFSCTQFCFTAVRASA
jgi:arsenite methyltransferase